MLVTTRHLHAAAEHRAGPHDLVLLGVAVVLLVVLATIAVGVGRESLQRALGNALDD